MSSPLSSSTKSTDKQNNTEIRRVRENRETQGSAATSIPSSSSDLLTPTADFLRLLKDSGAEKDALTTREIAFYLKEYIKKNVLYDLEDPRIVHCKNDLLGSVFGLERFTLGDVWELIGKHSHPVRPYPRWKHPQSASSQQQNRQLHYQAQPSYSPAKTATRVRTVSHTITLSSDSREPVTSSSSTPIKKPSSRRATAVSDSEIQPKKSGAPNKLHFTGRMTPEFSISIQQALDKRSRKRKRRSDKVRSSESTDGGTRSEQEPVPLAKRRQPSFNILYANREGATSDNEPWCFTVQLETSDESEVLSIQSKETVLVKDSSDDLWFLDTADDEISFDVGDDGVSLDFQSNFSEEYEVQSLSSNTISEWPSSTSDSGEDVLVVCNDSDIEFWADSSDLESDIEEEVDDDSLINGDVWRCPNCDLNNSPLSRYCERCWELRPGWLPDLLCRGNPHRRTYRRSMSAPGQCKSHKRNIKPESTSSEPESTKSEKKRNKKNTKPVVETVSTVSTTVENFSFATSFSNKTAEEHAPSVSALRQPIISMASHESPPLENAPQSVTHPQDVTKDNNLNFSSDSIEETLSLLPLPKIGLPTPGRYVSENRSRPVPIKKTNSGLDLAASVTDQGGKTWVAETEAASLGVKLRNDMNNDASTNINKLPILQGQNNLSGANNNNKLELPGVNFSSIEKNVPCASDNIVFCDSKPVSPYPVKRQSESTSICGLPTPKVCLSVTDTSNLAPVRSKLTRDDSGFVESNQSLDILRNNLSDTPRTMENKEVKSETLQAISREDSGLANMKEKSAKEKDKSEEDSKQGSQPCTTDLNYTKTTGELLKLNEDQPGIFSSQESSPWYGQNLSESSISQSQKSEFIEVQTNAEEQASHRTAGKEGYTDECMICLTGPKEASLIHGKVGHQVCCYHCAKILYKRGQTCPVCRRPIQKVVRNFIM